METEELIRSQPVDGVVLMGGCDKTTPGLILGATSAGVPAIFVPAGPMLRGNWHGKMLGSGSDAWKYWDERRAGNIAEKDWGEMQDGHRPLLRRVHDHGHGLDHDRPRRRARHVPARHVVDPGAGRKPRAHVLGRRPAHRRHGVGGPDADQDHDRAAPSSTPSTSPWPWAARPTPSSTSSPWRGAPATTSASTISTRASRKVPVIANIRPSGDTYLMEDFYYAGGLLGLMSRLKDHLDLDADQRLRRNVGEDRSRARRSTTTTSSARSTTPSTRKARSPCSRATSRPTAA